MASTVEGTQPFGRGSGTPLPQKQMTPWKLHVWWAGHAEEVSVALVDKGSTGTLIQLDLVPAATRLEPTVVKLRTVTGELAPMLGKTVVTIRGGGISVDFEVWVPAVQDPCILGLDFLRDARGVLDLGGNALTFPGGLTVELVHPTQPFHPDPEAVRTAGTSDPPVLSSAQSAAPLFHHHHWGNLTWVTNNSQVGVGID